MKPGLIMVALMLAGCSRKELPFDAKDATREIHRWVPTGTPAADARLIMEKHQFKCAAITHDDFATSDGGVMKGLDHIYCDRVSYEPPVERRWQAVLVLKDGKVSDIHVTTGLTGP
ncbi:MAG: hypothetical protein QM755_07015 [Luteolibacter sp.]